MSFVPFVLHRVRRCPALCALIGVTVACYGLQQWLDLRSELPWWAAPSALGVYTHEGLCCGQWWRLISYLFLHLSPWHLLGNMAGLLVVGIHLEPRIGSRRFLVLYFLCGFGSAWMMALLTNLGCPWIGAVPLEGASGAVVGVVAAMLVLRPGLLWFDLGLFEVPYSVAFALYLVVSAGLIVWGRHPESEVMHWSSALCGAVLAGLMHLVREYRKERKAWAILERKVFQSHKD